MANAITARLRKQREVRVTVDKITFTARRPTDVEALELNRKGNPFIDIARDFVIGWEGVTENDVVGGGGSDPVPFDVDLWAEWCADSPRFWQPLAFAVLEAYQAHAAALEAAQGN